VPDAATRRIPAIAPTGRTAACAAGVFAAALAIYLPSVGHGFINLDDPQYVTDNPFVLNPTAEHLRRVWREIGHPTTVAGYYQPATMTSLMLDSRIASALGRSAPQGPPHAATFHATAILLHALNATLCFLWCLRLSNGRIGAAFAAAMLFAWHPVNVEAVSWVCQRKALLSALFALSAFIAYDAYVRRPRGATLAAVALGLTLSLLSKPTGWLIPPVLLLLDAWPYRRLDRRAMVEKWPLFAIALIGGAVAFVSQRSSMGRARIVPLEDPFESLWVVLHNVGLYASTLLLPLRLSPQYPLPERAAMTMAAPAFLFGAGVALLIAILAARSTWSRGRAFAVAVVGYLLLLGPAIGAVEYMGAIAADRFQYLPMLLPLAAIALVMPRFPADRRGRLAAVIAAAVILGMGVKTFRQQAVWQNSVSYYRAALDFAPENPDATYGLGRALYERTTGARPDDPAARKEFADAQSLFEFTLKLRPTYSLAYFALGELWIERGEAERALRIIREGLAQPGADESGRFLEGLALTHLGRPAEAATCYEEYLSRRPTRREALRNLANAYSRLGRWPDAERRYAQLVALDPADDQAAYGLGIARMTLGDPGGAVGPLRAARALAPRNATTQYALACALAAGGRLAEAGGELEQALQLDPTLIPRANRQRELALLRNDPRWRERLDDAVTHEDPAATEPTR